jgi:hypothetical protein
VSARTYPPAPGWSPDGHRLKAPLEYSRGYDTLWVYGALCVRDGHAVTLTTASRNSVGYLELLQALDQAHPTGRLYLIADNLSSHASAPIREWLAKHPRIHHAFIPVGAAWLNLIEGWWRLLRREAYAGQSFANHHDIAYATRLATARLNQRATPWIWGRAAKPRRQLRRRFVYVL